MNSTYLPFLFDPQNVLFIDVSCKLLVEDQQGNVNKVHLIELPVLAVDPYTPPGPRSYSYGVGLLKIHLE